MQNAPDENVPPKEARIENDDDDQQNEPDQENDGFRFG
jgi:hypothetical protein